MKYYPLDNTRFIEPQPVEIDCQEILDNLTDEQTIECSYGIKTIVGSETLGDYLQFQVEKLDDMGKTESQIAHILRNLYKSELLTVIEENPEDWL